MTPSLRSINYEKRLKALNLITLSEKRQRGDMIMAARFVHFSVQMIEYTYGN